MPLQLVIVGFPQSGKTTVFNALTQSEAPTGVFSTAESEPNLATVKVPDERLDRLTSMFNPKRTIPADVQYFDVAGIAKGIGEQGLSGRLLGILSQGAALVQVVRAFESASVPSPEGSVDPLRDIEAMNLELMFSDLSLIEKRIPRLQAGIPKLRGAEREANERELAVLQRLQQALEAERPIREVEVEPEEEKLLRGYGFLTAKPLFILLNVGEEMLGGAADELVGRARARHQRPGVLIEAIAGKIEEEIARLDAADAEMFLADLGIAETSRERVVRSSYGLLGLISFFTVGPDECRAWTIARGTPAPEAAGVIHSDIQRGFIRAEVASYPDLIEAGGWSEARKDGKLRLEGKTYIVQDGDVCNFLFNVSKA